MKNNRQLFFNKLKINRRGKYQNSYLITEKIEQLYNKSSLLQFINNDFHYISSFQGNITYQINSKILQNFTKLPISTKIINSQNNILEIDVDNDFLNLPNLSIQDLQNINCQIINNNEHFVIDTPLPICKTIMNYGENYASGYIMKDKYGMYVEKHNTPHIYVPLTNLSKGYMILGVKYNNNLYLGSFIIPHNKALYIPPNIIHNDCYLHGVFRVFYTISNDYRKFIFNHNNFYFRFKD